MKYRILGKTGMKVSVVGVGTWQFGGEWGEQYTQPQADQILGRAKELGINLIDTAECYGDHLSELMVGNVICKDRDSWVVATKFGHKFHSNFERSELWTADDVRKQLEELLRSLQTDYIDLYQFHSGTNAAFDNEELWNMLNDQVQAGKIRHLGISIGSNDNLYQTERATQVGAEAIQVIYNRLDQTPEKEVFPSCIEQNLGVLARVPLASGLLSGKYKPGTKFTNENDIRSRRDDEMMQQRLLRVEEIQKNELPAGVPMAAWALAWCLQNPAVTCVIPGCKNVQQVEANASAAELDMVSENHPQAAA